MYKLKWPRLDIILVCILQKQKGKGDKRTVDVFNRIIIIIIIIFTRTNPKIREWGEFFFRRKKTFITSTGKCFSATLLVKVTAQEESVRASIPHNDILS